MSNFDDDARGLSRRRFLTSTGITAGVVAAGGGLAACGSQASQATQKSTSTPSSSGSSPSVSAGGDVDLSGVKPGKRIGVISYVSAAAAITRSLREFDRIKKDIGWEFDIVDAQGDTTRMGQIAQDFITKKVDGIIVNNGPSEALGDKLSGAKDAGIRVVGIWNLPTNGVEHVIYPSDWIAMGPMVEYVLQRIGLEGEIAMLYFDVNTPQRQRTLILETAFKYYAPGIKIVEKALVRVPGQLDDGRQKTTAFVPKHKNLKAIVATFDEPAMGAAQALKQLGREDIFVTGVDGLLEALDVMREDGPFAATVAMDCELQARAAVKALDDLFSGKKIGLQTTLDSPLVTRDNIPAAGEYAKGSVLPIYGGNA
jgi:ribose transport system substrate-binding protein